MVDKREILKKYECGLAQFSGPDGLYERHLIFDNIIAQSAAGMREEFDAAAHAVRDVLSQRWVRTEQTYDHLNPKRIYYLQWNSLLAVRYPITFLIYSLTLL